MKRNKKICSSTLKKKRSRINQKKSGGFFPYSHIIDNEFATEVFEELQIFRDGVLPDIVDVCFIHAIKDQIPADIVGKIKFDIRTECVPLTVVKKVCEPNGIYIKVRSERTNTNSNVTSFGPEDSEFKADICCIKKHYFKYVENTGITSHFLKNYEALNGK